MTIYEVNRSDEVPDLPYAVFRLERSDPPHPKSFVTSRRLVARFAYAAAAKNFVQWMSALCDRARKAGLKD